MTLLFGIELQVMDFEFKNILKANFLGFLNSFNLLFQLMQIVSILNYDCNIEENNY